MKYDLNQEEHMDIHRRKSGRCKKVGRIVGELSEKR